jgi:hypothetical protein
MAKYFWILDQFLGYYGTNLNFSRIFAYLVLAKQFYIFNFFNPFLINFGIFSIPQILNNFKINLIN